MAIADQGYGVPDKAADMQQLQQESAASADSLASFAAQAFGHLLSASSQNDDALGRVWQTARRSLTARASGNQTRLNDIGNTLAGSLGATATANKSQLAEALSSVGFFPSATGQSAGSNVGAIPQQDNACCWFGPTFNQLSDLLQSSIISVCNALSSSPPNIPPGCPSCADAINAAKNELAGKVVSAIWFVSFNKNAYNPSLVDYNLNYAFPSSPYGNPIIVTLPCAGTAPPPTPPPPPPIGLPPPPPTPPPPPPPNICNWYCVQFGTAQKSDIRCLYSTPESISAACLSIVSGPHPDELTCIHACKVCSVTTAPQPPPPQPQQQPPIQLPAPVAQGDVSCELLADGSLPPVGSAEWCACVESVETWIANIGNQVINFLLGGAQGQQQTKGFFSTILNSIVDLSAFGVPGSVFSGIVDNVRQVISDMWSTIQSAVAGAKLCRPDVMLGLCLAKTAITLLHKARSGTDALVWLTADVSIQITPLERVIEYLINHTCPVDIPSVGDAMECYLQHTAPVEQIRCWMRLRGANPDVWFPLIDARREKLHDKELIEYIRRNNGDTDTQVNALLSQGWVRPAEAAARVELYDELPTISDHLHWLQRNVFDDAYVQDYNLLDGFLDRFWAKFGPDLRSRGMRQQYAELHYAAHWILPPPTQLAQLVFRNRPGAVPENLVFTTADYSRLLAEQDIAPYFRDRLTAILHPIPALGYIRDMFRGSVITTEQLISYHQDLGYTLEDSERFAGVDEIQKRRMRATGAHGWMPAALAKAYQTQYLPEQSITDKMLYLGYTAEEAKDMMQRADSDLQATVFMRARSRILSGTVTQIRQALQVGVVTPAQSLSILQSLGFPADFAASIVALESAGAQTRRIRQAVQRLRSAFHDGEIDQAYAASALGTLGISPDAVQSYLAVWAVEQTPRRKRRTAQQIVKDVASQAISVSDALFRLTNLGYDDADQRLYLNDVRNQVIANEAKMAAAEQKIVNGTARQLAAIAAEAARQREKAIALLQAEETPSKLDNWAASGLIDQTYHHARLAMYGWDDEAITLHWEAACAKKNAACKPTAPQS